MPTSRDWHSGFTKTDKTDTSRNWRPRVELRFPRPFWVRPTGRQTDRPTNRATGSLRPGRVRHDHSARTVVGAAEDSVASTRLRVAHAPSSCLCLDLPPQGGRSRHRQTATVTMFAVLANDL